MTASAKVIGTHSLEMHRADGVPVKRCGFARRLSASTGGDRLFSSNQSARPLALDADAFAFPAAANRLARVVSVVSMAAGAVGFLCVSRRRCNAAQNIRPPRNRLQMGGVHAAPVSTKMIDFQIVWDLADQGLVGDAMSGSRSVVESDARIPAAACRPGPFPTTGVVDRHLLPEAQRQPFVVQHLATLHSRYDKAGNVPAAGASS